MSPLDKHWERTKLVMLFLNLYILFGVEVERTWLYWILIWALWSGVTTESPFETMVVLRIKLGQAVCKKSTLTLVISLLSTPLSITFRRLKYLALFLKYGNKEHLSQYLKFYIENFFKFYLCISKGLCSRRW